MKKSILTISMLYAASATWAAIITDDFNRPDTDPAYTSDMSLIGPGWAQDNAANLWSINGGKVYSNPAVRPASMYNTGLEMLNGGGNSFTYSIEQTTRDPDAWVGVAFNYQDYDNHYILRYKSNSTSYQVLARVAGAYEVMKSGAASGTLLEDTAYIMTVTSDTAYDFDFTITQGATVLLSGNVVDPNSNFTGGYAGVHIDRTGGAPVKYDNFSLEVIPEPASIGLIGISAAGALFIRRRLML